MIPGVTESSVDKDLCVYGIRVSGGIISLLSPCLSDSDSKKLIAMNVIGICNIGIAFSIANKKNQTKQSRPSVS